MLGFKGDLLPRDARYWTEIDHTPRWTFEAAAERALADEAQASGVRGLAGQAEEAVVQLVSPKLRR